MGINSDRFVPNGQSEDSFYLEHIQRYDFAKPFIRQKKVLDLGCGSGYGSFELIKLGAKKVEAVDISSKAINYAKKNYHHKNLFFRVADATSIPFPDNSFDVIVSFEVIEHIKNYQMFIKEAFRVLKKPGYFIFSTPNKDQYRANTSAYHYKEFNPTDLKQLFKKYGGLKLYGQYFLNQKFIDQEINYFKRYNQLSLGGNKIVKKIFLLFPPSFKSFVYRLVWPQPTKPLAPKIAINQKILVSQLL